MEKLQEIEMEIQIVIEHCIGIKVSDVNQNLLEDSLNVPVVDWLYVIQAIEKRYKKNIAYAIIQDSYQSFNIKGLASKLV